MSIKELVSSGGPGGESDGHKWHIIYPQYINSNLTLYMGRRLARTDCVADPKSAEIKDVLEAMNCFEVICDHNKCYSREVDKELVANRGYVKYCLVRNRQTQELIDTNRFEQKKYVLRYVSQMIPKLKTRTKTAVAQNPQQNQQNISQNNPKKKKKKN